MNAHPAHLRLRAAALALVLLAATGSYAAPGDVSIPPESPRPAVQALWIDDPDGPGSPVLVGSDSGHQLVVTAERPDGSLVDATTEAQYEAQPEGIVQIAPTGWVTPQHDGHVTITATFGEATARTELTVTHFVDPPLVNFPNQVVPIFTRYGCNGGGCHGKSGGQNGFRLSLLGFGPHDDYQWLLQESRGRRLFPAAPQLSLLLLKATGTIPHGGGTRLEPDSPAYRLLARWIRQGMPYGQPDDPVVERIAVYPRERTLPPNSSQQLRVMAYYSDGSWEDVTRTTQLEANQGEMAEVDGAGLVTNFDRPGTVAVMARYQGHVDVFRALIPRGGPTDAIPEPKNLVDRFVFQQLRKLGLPPSPVCDDATFLRRVTIAIAGRIPTVDEAREFAADAAPDKRERWIDRLLDSGDYADHFANKWSAILRNKRRTDRDRMSTFAFHGWIRESLMDNKPYDVFVREILTASGSASLTPAVAWYREVDDQSALVEDSAQLFLGLRIQCARCHHHPFEKWSQEDYYGLAAFFSRIGRQQMPNETQLVVFHQPGSPQARHPKTGQPIAPRGLDAAASQLAETRDPRLELAAWMTSPDNPFFARALVNRYWKHFFGRGIVDPEDDMRVTNPATNPELLDGLAEDFIQSGFDLKHLVRTICNSTVFQFDSLPNAFNQGDNQSFSRFYPQRLSAETLADSIDYVTGVPTAYDGMPPGTRAMQLPDSGFDSYFLSVFGRPEASSACECERSFEANLAQSLHLLNSSSLQAKLSDDTGRVAALAAEQDRSDEEKIEDLYLACFSRPPSDEELATALEHVQGAAADKRRQAFEDVLWALINTKEFLFNH